MGSIETQRRIFTGEAGFGFRQRAARRGIPRKIEGAGMGPSISLLTIRFAWQSNCLMAITELSRAAEENLRTIRTLMERATVYRAISAGPALLGGLLAIALATVLQAKGTAVSGPAFAASWVGALLVVGVFNTALLIREARLRGATFPSPSTRHGLRALAPPMSACGLMGLAIIWTGGDAGLGVAMWVVGYGLGLLATASFAPRSIRALGWAFLLAGMGWFFWRELTPGAGVDDNRDAARMMGVTFGGFHLVYAIRTGWWKRRGDS
jgi:hypothetical protein